MKKTILVSAAILTALGAAATPPMHKEPRSSNPLKDKAHEVFTENAPDGLKDVVPHFAIFGKEDKFYLGISGQVTATLGWDFGAPVSNPNELITYDIEPVADGDHTRFHLSAMQSGLFFNFVGLPDSKDRIGAFIGMYFLNDYAPVLQYAYLKYRGIKAGYDYSTFSDNGAMPPTIDFEGPNSGTAFPVAMASYTYDFGKKKDWSVTAGLELPQYSITPSHITRAVSQAVPDIPVALKYSWNRKNDWVRLSGVVRNMNYRNIPDDKNIDVVGWGVALSGTAEIAPGLRGYWNGVYGRGIASYIQDLTGNGMDLTPCGSGGALKASNTWGAFGGLQYDFSPSVYCSATYSHVRNYAKEWNGISDGTDYGAQYRYAQYAVGNVFWQISPILKTGIEYIYARRVNNDGSQAHVSRLQTMLQLSF
ncbi:MAG: hypothetical protein HDR80_05200 [Bacteroides sp.]|nr:hypothetical protein [Bacteroides sp.]